MSYGRWWVALAVIWLSTPCTAEAQGPWSAFVAGGAVGFGGATRLLPNDFIDDFTFKPTPTTRLHLGVARDFGRIAAVLDLAYSQSGLGGYSNGISQSQSPAMTLYEARLLASYRLLGRAGGPSLEAALGPMLQVWNGEAIIDTQARLGGAASVKGTAPLSAAWGLFIGGSLGVAGSPFTADFLAEVGPIEPTSIWTRELVAGLRFRW